MSESHSEFTPEEQVEVDRLVETGEFNVTMARAAVRGTFDNPPAGLGQITRIEEVPEQETPLEDPHKRVSPHRTKPGHVRDFTDGGRDDEYRGGELKPPQTPEAQDALDEAMPELQEWRDDVLKSELLRLFGSGEITHTELRARWQAHLDGREKRLAKND